MGQLIDIPQSIRECYQQLSGYFESVTGYLQDPKTAPGDPGDYISKIDVAGLRRAVQARVRGQASTTNAALLAAFRDLESAQAEYALRGMTRSDYYSGAAAEAGVLGAKWKTTMNDRLFNLTGKR